MAELTQEEVEQISDVVPEFVEVLNGVRTEFAVLGGIIAAGVGAAVGYYVAVNRLRGRYGRIAEEEISQMREHFHAKVLAMEGKPALDGLVRDLGYVEVEPQEGEDVAPPMAVHPPAESVLDDEVTKNVFADRQAYTDEWNFEAELASRNNDEPYVIHIDEQHERGYSETTLTYYAGDDVLCDERDKIIDNKEELVGDHNLDRFGHGSGDPLIVYIRNDALSAEFEVVKSEKTYAEEVHGFSHSDYHRRRPRFDDDE